MTATEGLFNGTLAEAFNNFREAMFTEMRVALPGVVVSYDSTLRQAEVLPLIMRRSVDAASPVPLPNLPNVPVMHPQTAKGALLLPIGPGDPVMLIFSDRSLDQWKASDGAAPTEAEEKRKHEISDLWAIPGGWPNAKSFTPATGAENLLVQVSNGTKIYIGNSTNELLQIASDAFTSLKSLAEELKSTLAGIQAITTTVPPGPSAPVIFPIDNIATFTPIEASVDSIISKVDSEIESLAEIKV